MNAGRHLLTALICISAAVAGCQREPPRGDGSGLAVLARGAESFTQATPGEALEFPRDHGPHPDYRIEWWYLTANLQDEAGDQYGAQWTLFRYALQAGAPAAPATPWQSSQVYMAHMAITTPSAHFPFQRYARGGGHGDIAQAGVMAAPFSAWLDNWSLSSTTRAWLPLQLRASQDDYGIRLDLDGRHPPVLQGENGFSRKHPEGGGSWYFSQPFLQAKGELQVDGRTIPVTGNAWLDREWSSQFLQPAQAGWDWFALHLENGQKLMLFRIRQQDGESGDHEYRHGVLISPDQGSVELAGDRIRFEVLSRERVGGNSLPMKWRIGLPQIDRELVIEALHPQQWMDVDFPYWEGVITASSDDPGWGGRGYMELTGY